MAFLYIFIFLIILNYKSRLKDIKNIISKARGKKMIRYLKNINLLTIILIFFISTALIIIFYNIIFYEIYSILYIIILGFGIILLILVFIYRDHLKGFL
jgi:hypothetical protein